VRLGVLLAILLLRSALWTLSVIFGSLGVFFALKSFSVPDFGSYAVVMLGAALGINYGLNS